MDFLSHLNPPQQEAVQHDQGPLLVLAGAGSGKTRVITSRIAYLICEKNIHPSQIMAVTFTNKAAREMAHRVEQLLVDYVSTAALTISTFHSLCARLLRRHAEHVNLDWHFNILDSDDQQRLIRKLLQDIHNETPDRAEIRRLQSFIEDMKNKGLIPSQAHEKAFNLSMEDDASFYERYEQALQRSNCVDFGGLLLHLVNIFRTHPEIAHRYSQQWQYILVDEFQDTNPVQYELLHHLTSTHDNLTVVGDDDQSIYRWRGATLNNLLGFEERFKKARTIKLEQNYRSTQIILNAANDIIQLNPKRHNKTLWTERRGGEAITVFAGADDREEAVYVVNQIVDAIREGSSYNDIAILYRTNAQGRLFEEQLRRFDIPYQIIGGLSFYARQEIKDVLAYLTVALNPAHDMALLRVINTPTRGIGKTTIDKLVAASAIQGIDTVYGAVQYLLTDQQRTQHDLFATNRPRPKGPEQIVALDDLQSIKGGSLKGIQQFYEIIEATRDDLAHYESLAPIVEQLIGRIKYWEYLDRTEPERAEDKRQNLAELLNAMQDFEANLDDSTTPEEADELFDGSPAAGLLQAFLERSALVENTDTHDEISGSITLMTVHGAKGLEFDTVFLVGMEDKLFPSKRMDSDQEELEEERRLAYVAVTRAQNRLFMTYAHRRRHYGQFQDTDPSPFLTDISPQYLQVDPRSMPVSISRRTDPRSLAKKRQQAFFGDGVDNKLWEFDQSPEMVRGEYGRAIMAEQAKYSQYDEFSQLPPSEWENTNTQHNTRTYKAQADSLIGATVSHSRFGIGKVLETSGSGDKMKLTIHFPIDGTKTIIRRFVKVLG